MKTTRKRAAKQHNPPQMLQTSPYHLYLNSLVPTGRKAVACMLKRVCREMGWMKAAELYPWHTLQYQHVQAVRSALLNAGYAATSINLALAAMRGVAKTAFHLGVMDSEQWMRIQSVKTVRGSAQRKKRRLVKTEIRSVISASRKTRNQCQAARDLALFLIGCTAGLRCFEILALDIADFDRETGTLRVVCGKGRKQREVHMCEITCRAIKRWLAYLDRDHGPMFCRINHDGEAEQQALSKQGLRNVLVRLQQQSGIPPFTPHDMRRTFITQLLENGNDINTVRLLAGHTSVSTTVIYDCREQRQMMQASRHIGF